MRATHPRPSAPSTPSRSPRPFTVKQRTLHTVASCAGLRPCAATRLPAPDAPTPERSPTPLLSPLRTTCCRDSVSGLSMLGAFLLCVAKPPASPNPRHPRHPPPPAPGRPGCTVSGILTNSWCASSPPPRPDPHPYQDDMTPETTKGKNETFSLSRAGRVLLNGRADNSCLGRLLLRAWCRPSTPPHPAARQSRS